MVVLVRVFDRLTSIEKGSVWVAVEFLDTFRLLLTFVIYLFQNIYSYLSNFFFGCSSWSFGSYIFVM